MAVVAESSTHRVLDLSDIFRLPGLAQWLSPSCCSGAMDPCSVFECLWFGCVASSCVRLWGCFSVAFSSFAFVVLLSWASDMAADMFRACHDSPSLGRGCFLFFQALVFCRFSLAVNCHVTSP